MKEDIILKLILGKKLEEAQKICEENGYVCSVNREDLHHYMITCDFRFDRINIEIDEGKITKSSIG